jgi:hypothetical protein
LLRGRAGEGVIVSSVDFNKTKVNKIREKEERSAESRK